MTRPDPLAMPRLRFAPRDAGTVAVGEGHMTALVERWGSAELRWYAPRGTDPQTPHDRDEIYFVVSGRALFSRSACRLPFGAEPDLHVPGEEMVEVSAGEVLFVPAGTTHCFSDISDDFGTWVVFYGPEGGEAPEPTQD